MPLSLRHFIFILVIFLLDSCKGTSEKIDIPKEWTEEQKRDYFSQNLSRKYGAGQFMESDSTKTFNYFFKTHYPDIKTQIPFDAFPYAFEEEYIDTTNIDSSRHWLRLIIKPCFRLPYCFVLEKKGNSTYLTTKITNGYGSNYTGVLISTTKFYFGDTLFNNFSKQLNSLNFWTLGIDTTCKGGLDGEIWMFEAIDSGKYNILTRWLPQHCGDSTTLKLFRIGNNFAKLCKLDNLLMAIDAPKSGM